MRIARWIFLLAILTVSLARGAIAGTIAAEEYQRQLAAADKVLERMEEHPPRRLRKFLQSIPRDVTVRRADGARQSLSADDALHHGDNGGTSMATADDVRRVRTALALHRAALESWMRQGDYTPADAQHIVEQLAATGQIRTAPTPLEQWWSQIRKWFKTNVIDAISRLYRAIVNWLFGRIPAAAPKPGGDARWIGYLLILACSALLLYVLWLLLGKYFTGHGPAYTWRNQQLLDNADAQLLRLPPQELRERALELAAQGDYRQALRHLYIATLVNLERSGVWRYDPRRTNWEHIAGLRAQPAHRALVGPLASLTRRFDRVRYGNAPCDAGEWQRFLHETDSLSGQLAPAHS